MTHHHPTPWIAFIVSELLEIAVEEIPAADLPEGEPEPVPLARLDPGSPGTGDPQAAGNRLKLRRGTRITHDHRQDGDPCAVRGWLAWRGADNMSAIIYSIWMTCDV